MVTVWFHHTTMPITQVSTSGLALFAAIAINSVTRTLATCNSLFVTLFSSQFASWLELACFRCERCKQSTNAQSFHSLPERPFRFVVYTVYHDEDYLFVHCLFGRYVGFSAGRSANAGNEIEFDFGCGRSVGGIQLA